MVVRCAKDSLNIHTQTEVSAQIAARFNCSPFQASLLEMRGLTADVMPKEVENWLSPYLPRLLEKLDLGADNANAAALVRGLGPSSDVVVYGDIHDPFLRSGREGVLANVGSVGNQLDDPTPSYVILEGDADGGAEAPFGIQFVRVPYDVEAEIEATLALGMPETEAYILELRTGVYRGDHAALGLSLARPETSRHA